MAQSRRLLVRVLAATRWLRVGVAVVVVAALVGLAAWQLAPLQERKERVESGRAVTATVTTAEFRTENERSVYTEYYATVEYEYTVDGGTYTSRRIFPGPRLSQPYSDSNLVPHYETGQEVEVHYDPTDPDYAWLTRSESRVSTRTGQTALIGTVVAVLLAYLYAELAAARVDTSAVRAGGMGTFGVLGLYAGVLFRALGVAVVGVGLAYGVSIGLGIYFTV